MATTSEIRVFGMGEQGVHVSVGPLHTEIGDVTTAQNCSFFGTGQRGGLASRTGFYAFASGCAGAVLSVLSVTFSDTVTTTFLTDMNLDVVIDDDGIPLSEG